MSLTTETTISQCADILRALKQGRTLTAMEALSEFGCFRLAARIHDLRGDGYAITTLWSPTATSAGLSTACSRRC